MRKKIIKEWQGKRYVAVMAADGSCEGCECGVTSEMCRFMCDEEHLTAAVIWLEIKEGMKNVK